MDHSIEVSVGQRETTLACLLVSKSEDPEVIPLLSHC